MDEFGRTAIGNCSSTQLKTLLDLARAPGGIEGSVLSQAMNLPALPGLLDGLTGDMARSGSSLLGAVCAPESSAASLCGIKDAAKALLLKAQRNDERAAATFLYHAAIAAAFGRHGVNISSFPIDARWTLYEDLATVMKGSAFGLIFREAADRIEATPA